MGQSINLILPLNTLTQRDVAPSSYQIQRTTNPKHQKLLLFATKQDAIPPLTAPCVYWRIRKL